MRARLFSPGMRGARGFTLIELAIVVVVMAILLILAYPTYRSSILKSHRPAAKTALLDLASREERFFTANNAYSSDLQGLLGYGANPVPVPDAANAYYLMTVTLQADGNFLATATPQGSQAADACGTFTLTSLGLRGTTPATPTDAGCWP